MTRRVTFICVAATALAAVAPYMLTQDASDSRGWTSTGDRVATRRAFDETTLLSDEESSEFVGTQKTPMNSTSSVVSGIKEAQRWGLGSGNRETRGDAQRLLQERGLGAERDAAPSVEPMALDVELAPGMMIPVALVEPAEGTPSQEAREKLRLADEFEEEVLQAASKADRTEEGMGKAWNEAQTKADHRFRLLFGKAAYDHESRRLMDSGAVKVGR